MKSQRFICWQFVVALLLTLWIPSLMAQSAGTGALTGTVTDSTGAVVPGNSEVAISLGDLEPDLLPRTAKFQWFYFKDANNACKSMKCLVLMTAPEPNP